MTIHSRTVHIDCYNQSVFKTN